MSDPDLNKLYSVHLQVSDQILTNMFILTLIDRGNVKVKQVTLQTRTSKQVHLSIKKSIK